MWSTLITNAVIYFQESTGTCVLSIDALFGLPRKKSAGRSFRESLHGHLFFSQQSLVDEYVQYYKMGKKSSKVLDV